MPLPSNADRVVVRGIWLDETTGAGVSGATVTFEPVALPGQGATPNLRDITARGHIKTRTTAAAVHPDTGYYAALVLSSDDPDLDAYGGRRVTFTGEQPFTIAVPHNAPMVAVDAEMVAAIPSLSGVSQVRAIWLVAAAVVGGTPPAPLTSYLTSQQTVSLVADAVEDHDDDPDAHQDIRDLIGQGDGSGSQLVASGTAAQALSGHRLVTPGPSGLVYADNQTAAHVAAPLWLTSAAASSGAPVSAVTAGPVTEPSWSFTPGPLWLGQNGQLVQTPPTPPALFRAQVGYATTPTTVVVDRSPSIRIAP